MHETNRLRRWAETIGAAGLLVMALATSASPQSGSPAGTTSQAGKTGAGMEGQGTGAGSDSANGTAGAVLVRPGQGGVAGTGLGKMPPAGDAPGTGQSVKGPPGQSVAPMGTTSP